MIALRSLLFNTAFWIWTIGFGILMSPLLLHAKLARIVPRIWIAVTLWLLRVICNITIEIRGREHLAHRPCIIAAKHQSALDTLLLWQLLNGPAFILKYQLCLIPIFGWYLMRMRPIAIRRESRAQALNAIATQAQERIAQGRAIVIFPEGTRTKPGATTRYKMGGITLLYESLSLPIIPAALNTGVVWGRNAFLKKPGRVVIAFLPPIQPGMDVQTMAERLQQQIESESQKLL